MVQEFALGMYLCLIALATQPVVVANPAQHRQLNLGERAELLKTREAVWRDWFTNDRGAPNAVGVVARGFIAFPRSIPKAFLVAMYSPVGLLLVVLHLAVELRDDTRLRAGSRAVDFRAPIFTPQTGRGVARANCVEDRRLTDSSRFWVIWGI
jgi:hypothetical protein